MPYVVVEVGCIECQAAEETRVMGPFATFEEALAPLQLRADEITADYRRRGFPGTQTVEIEDWEFSPSLRAQVSESASALQVHELLPVHAETPT